MHPQARLTAQEETNMRGLAGRTRTGLAALNASLTARLAADGEALAARLASAVAVAQSEAASLARTVGADHAARARRLDSVQRLTQRSDAEQAPPPPLSCSNWTRLVLLPVLSGHVSSLPLD
jgi:phosphate starvation-inducible protein PhoH